MSAEYLIFVMQPDLISTPTLNILAAGLANVGNVSKALELVLQVCVCLCVFVCACVRVCVVQASYLR
jgi:hypothetical protein